MEMFTAEQRERLRRNGELWLTQDVFAARIAPVIELHSPASGRTWLVAAVHPNDQDRVLALFDLADGDPQIKWTRTGDIAGRDGRIECQPIEPSRQSLDLRAHADDARRNGGAIVRRLVDGRCRCAPDALG